MSLKTFIRCLIPTGVERSSEQIVAYWHFSAIQERGAIDRISSTSGHADKLGRGIIRGMSLFTRCGQTSGRLSPLALTAHLPELASQLHTPES
jgi:hypothetical protein